MASSDVRVPVEESTVHMLQFPIYATSIETRGDTSLRAGQRRAFMTIPDFDGIPKCIFMIATGKRALQRMARRGRGLKLRTVR